MKTWLAIILLLLNVNFIHLYVTVARPEHTVCQWFPTVCLFITGCVQCNHSIVQIYLILFKKKLIRLIHSCARNMFFLPFLSCYSSHHPSDLTCDLLGVPDHCCMHTCVALFLLYAVTKTHWFNLSLWAIACKFTHPQNWQLSLSKNRNKDTVQRITVGAPYNCLPFHALRIETKRLLTALCAQHRVKGAPIKHPSRTK